MEMQATHPTRILIVDDHALVRQGIRMLIETNPQFVVMGEAGDRVAALSLVAGDEPDIILLDLDLGSESGLDLIRDLHGVAAGARILILTGLRDSESLRRAVRLGASGIVQKEVAAEVLLKAIERVRAGEVWLDRSTTASLLAEMSQDPASLAKDPESVKIASLSAREREVISLIGEGLSNKRIAERLTISEITVRHHLTSIFAKLEVSDRLELLVYAYRNRLAGPPV